MKVNCVETELPRIGFLPRNSLSAVADVMERRRTRRHFHEHKLSRWQIIVLQSKVNGCLYRGEDLPQTHWEWPKKTWFQERLSHQLINNLEFTAQRGGA
jgi:hypothetical protein